MWLWTNESFVITHLALVWKCCQRLFYLFQSIQPGDNAWTCISVCGVGKAWLFTMCWHLAVKLASSACLCSEYQITVMCAKLPSALCQRMLLLWRAKFHYTESHMTRHNVLTVYSVISNAETWNYLIMLFTIFVLLAGHLCSHKSVSWGRVGWSVHLLPTTPFHCVSLTACNP